MAISLKATGAWVEALADATPTLVGTPAAGDRYYIWATWKDFSITTTVDASSGNWVEVTEFADGAVASGNGTGSMKVGCWYRDWVSGDVNPTINFSGTPQAAYCMQLWQKGASETWDTPTFVTAAWPVTATTQTISASSTVVVPDGSVAMCLIGLRDDSAAFTRAATTGIDVASGITWNGNYVESPATHGTFTGGFDCAADLGHRFVTTGGTVTLRATATISAVETGAILWVVQSVSTPPPPAISTLTDNFNAGWSNGVVWTDSGSADTTKVAAVGGTIRIDHTVGPQYNNLSAVTAYDLTGGAAYVKIVDFGNVSLVSHNVGLSVRIDGNNWVAIGVDNNNLTVDKKVTGTQTNLLATPLDQTAHRWFRIRESGGTTFFDTAPDGMTWTNRHSVANVIAMTGLKPFLESGCWQTEASASYAVFDNFNTLPITTIDKSITVAVNRASFY
jgi:hypothetical protein